MNVASTPISLIRWLLLLLVMIGVPLGISLTFPNQLAEHPLISIALLVVYEIIVVIGRVTSKVWSRLEDELVDDLYRWISRKRNDLLGNYRTKYLQYLQFRHRDFDVKGLTTQNTFNLELEQVFVQLAVAPGTIHDASSDPIRVPKELSKGTHEIWDYLITPQLGNFVIVGPPGSGKTTLLKHLTLVLWRRDSKVRKLPILLFLRNHAAAILENPQLTLVDAIEASLAKFGPQLPNKWFLEQLEKGNFVVMLDGLDEVAQLDIRRAVVSWVEGQIVKYRRNRFIITSRPFGYRSNPLSSVTVLEVLPFNRSQIERFVQNWYLATEIMSSQKNDQGVQFKAQEGADDLLARLYKTPSLLSLAVNPLLLTMIATVHRFKNSLPGRRVELYSEICDVFLGKRRDAAGIESDLTPIQRRRVLQVLAYSLMQRNKREVSLDEAITIIATPLKLVSPSSTEELFLKSIENESGLLVERESGIYSFAHLTFQEYLAAVNIIEQRLDPVLQSFVGQSWWHETIRLYCAQTDATQIIKACLRDAVPTIEQLRLAIECLEEAREVEPDARQQLEKVLDEGLDDTDEERRKLVAEALLSLRLARMGRYDEDIYIDNGLVTQAEYQIFLNEQMSLGHYYQPDHWINASYAQGKAREPILGVRYSDVVAFCSWLSGRDYAEWTYRVPTLSEISRDSSSGRDNGTFWVSQGTRHRIQNQPNHQQRYTQNSIYRIINGDRLQVLFVGLLLELATARDLISVILGARALEDAFQTIDLTIQALENSISIVNILRQEKVFGTEAADLIPNLTDLLNSLKGLDLDLRRVSIPDRARVIASISPLQSFLSASLSGKYPFPRSFRGSLDTAEEIIQIRALSSILRRVLVDARELPYFGNINVIDARLSHLELAITDAQNNSRYSRIRTQVGKLLHALNDMRTNLSNAMLQDVTLSNSINEIKTNISVLESELPQLQDERNRTANLSEREAARQRIEQLKVELTNARKRHLLLEEGRASNADPKRFKLAFWTSSFCSLVEGIVEQTETLRQLTEIPHCDDLIVDLINIDADRIAQVLGSNLSEFTCNRILDMDLTFRKVEDIFNITYSVSKEERLANKKYQNRAQFLRSYIRVLSLTCVVGVHDSGTRSKTNDIITDRNRKALPVDDSLGIWLDFVCLEARIAGRAQAYEGIRLVKERKKTVQ